MLTDKQLDPNGGKTTVPRAGEGIKKTEFLDNAFSIDE
jgi:hypothetical protein